MYRPSITKSMANRPLLLIFFYNVKKNIYSCFCLIVFVIVYYTINDFLDDKSRYLLPKTSLRVIHCIKKFIMYLKNISTPSGEKLWNQIRDDKYHSFTLLDFSTWTPNFERNLLCKFSLSNICTCNKVNRYRHAR